MSNDDDRTELQALHDEMVAKVKNIDESIAGIDDEIAKLDRQESAVEWAINKLSDRGYKVEESPQADWAQYHLDKYIGSQGTYGIRDMRRKLEESRTEQSGDRDAYMKLIPIYYAILNNEDVPSVEDIPEYDPDAPCVKETPDYSFCNNRSALPIDKNEGGKGTFSKGDLIMLDNKIRISLKDGKGYDFNSDGSEWAYVGVQGANWDGRGEATVDGVKVTIDHEILAWLSENKGKLRDLILEGKK